MRKEHQTRRKRYLGRPRRKPGTWRARHAALIQRCAYAAVSLALVVLSVQLVYSVVTRWMAPEPEPITIAEPAEPVDVTIEGAVERPGVYAVAPGTVLSEVLARSVVRRSADLTGIDVDHVVRGPVTVDIPFVVAPVDSGPFAGIGLTATEFKRGAVEEAQMRAELDAINERSQGEAAAAVNLRNFDFLIIGAPIFYVVVSLDAKNETIQLTQVPAETRVSTPTATNPGWLREAYALGGPASTVAHISRVTGFSLDHYVVQDPAVMVQAIDLMGGVTVNVGPAEASLLRLPIGAHRIDGETALRYLAAYRETADVASLSEEQSSRMVKWLGFMRSVFDEFRAQNWWTTVRIARTVALGSETSFSLADVLGLAKLMQESDGWRILTHVSPGRWVNEDGRLYWEPDLPVDRVQVVGGDDLRPRK